MVEIYCILNVCVRWASCQPKWATYNPWGFGALCGIVGKAATVTSGDCVWLLVTEAHGVHRLASAADDPLQRETRRYCQWIHFGYYVETQHTDRFFKALYTTYMWLYTKFHKSKLSQIQKLTNIDVLVNTLLIHRLVLFLRCMFYQYWAFTKCGGSRPFSQRAF